MNYRHNKITINLNKLAHNYNIVCASLSNNTMVFPVIKANAYGHGIVEAATTLQKLNTPAFCVALVEEGELLRNNGINNRIILLGLSTLDSIEPAIKNNLVITVCTVSEIKEVQNIASKFNKIVEIQIAIDTGMNRIGLNSKENLIKLLYEINNSPNIKLFGAFTHFAEADSNDDFGSTSFTKEQFDKFTEYMKILPKNINLSLANSAAIIRFPQTYLNSVRAGIVLYGYSPVKTDLNLLPVMEWTTEVVYVKRVLQGETIGYGRTYIADKDMIVATCAIGYADGYKRSFSNKSKVIINNNYANVVGNVCMDLIMVDVSNISNVKIGDEVVVMGERNGLKVDAEYLAQLANTISYEILLSPSQRVAREYLY